MTLQSSVAASPTLAAAQKQLQKRRQQHRRERIAQDLPLHTDEHGRLILPQPTQTGDSRNSPKHSHQRWESQALARHLSFRAKRRAAETRRKEALTHNWLRPPAVESHASSDRSSQHDIPPVDPSDTFTLHPDLAIAMLKNECAAAGRVWLLLRALDHQGCGWVSLARTRELLTDKLSPLRICGWRQMRNLLVQGDGLFWQRDDHRKGNARIWLRAPAKVAATLGIPRFRMKPVSVPISVLLQGIGAVRAHFYTSYHSGRDSQKPIARQTLTDLTGVPRRSQRIYEEKAGVKSRQNWGVGSRHEAAEVQRQAAEHGHAIFRLDDNQGKFGAAGESYVAWQMPNSYVGPHAPHSSACKKRINRQLTDLLNEGMTGNGERQVDGHSSGDESPSIRYFEHGGAASRAYNRHAGNDLYWRAATSYHRYDVWHILPATKEVKV